MKSDLSVKDMAYGDEPLAHIEVNEQPPLPAPFDKLDEELRLAARIQCEFLPQEFPTMAGVGFDVLYRPAGYVSGDTYDVQQIDDRLVAFYVADAVGHGVPAALLTMLNSCASGVVVVNIDNGFSAGVTATLINRKIECWEG